VLGIVGESGCGKTVTSYSIMGLIRKPGKIVAGEVFLEGKDLTRCGSSELEDLRGNQIAMIFQQPLSSLNPVFTVGDQVAETLQKHQGMSREQAWEKTVDLFERVGLPDARKRTRAYPHELSGGQAQRVMIAIALANRPKLLIADEPTTALDVTIQAQILDLLREMQEGGDMAVILITHNLGVVAEMAKRIAVMYAGSIVEQAPVESLFTDPKHPYTRGLLGSIPVLGKTRDRLDVIPGVVPSLIDLPPGCRFASRCQERKGKGLRICEQTIPDLQEIKAGHFVRCWLYE
jgi:oligopeptide/dipeptide ABC transporter ATP-binding protein